MHPALLFAPHVNNSPLNFVDPTGHFTCSSDPNNDDYCPNHSSFGGGTGGGGDNEDDSGKGNTPNLEDITDDIINSSCVNGDFLSASCLSDISYFSDNLALMISTGVMILTDTIGAVAIAGLCEAGLGGCAVGIVIAVLFDMVVTQGHPLSLVENGLGILAFATTATADIITGDTPGLKFGTDGIHLYVSKDTLVSYGTMIGGFIPEANIDFLASGVQLKYDNARRNGLISNATYDLFGSPPDLWGHH